MTSNHDDINYYFPQLFKNSFIEKSTISLSSFLSLLNPIQHGLTLHFGATIALFNSSALVRKFYYPKIVTQSLQTKFQKRETTFFKQGGNHCTVTL